MKGSLPASFFPHRIFRADAQWQLFAVDLATVNSAANGTAVISSGPCHAGKAVQKALHGGTHGISILRLALATDGCEQRQRLDALMSMAPLELPSSQSPVRSGTQARSGCQSIFRVASSKSVPEDGGCFWTGVFRRSRRRPAGAGGGC